MKHIGYILTGLGLVVGTLALIPTIPIWLPILICYNVGSEFHRDRRMAKMDKEYRRKHGFGHRFT